MFSASVKQGARVHKLPRGPGLALGGPVTLYIVLKASSHDKLTGGLNSIRPRVFDALGSLGGELIQPPNLFLFLTT